MFSQGNLAAAIFNFFLSGNFFCCFFVHENSFVIIDIDDDDDDNNAMNFVIAEISGIEKRERERESRKESSIEFKDLHTNDEM